MKHVIFTLLIWYVGGYVLAFVFRYLFKKFNRYRSKKNRRDGQMTKAYPKSKTAPAPRCGIEISDTIDYCEYHYTSEKWLQQAPTCTEITGCFLKRDWGAKKGDVVPKSV